MTFLSMKAGQPFAPLMLLIQSITNLVPFWSGMHTASWWLTLWGMPTAWPVSEACVLNGHHRTMTSWMCQPTIKVPQRTHPQFHFLQEAVSLCVILKAKFKGVKFKSDARRYIPHRRWCPSIPPSELITGPSQWQAQKVSKESGF